MPAQAKFAASWLICALAAALCVSAMAQSSPPDRDALIARYAQLPHFARASLSPSGHAAAYLAAHNGKYHATITDFDTSRTQTLLHDKGRITDVHWIGDRRLALAAESTSKTPATQTAWLLGARERIPTFPQLSPSKAVGLARLRDRDGAGLWTLQHWYVQPAIRVLDPLAQRPDDVLLTAAVDDVGSFHVLRMSLAKLDDDDTLSSSYDFWRLTRNRTSVAGRSPNVQHWMAQDDGALAVGYGYLRGRYVYAIRGPNESLHYGKRTTWLREGWVPLAFAADRSRLYVQRYEDGRLRTRFLDRASGELGGYVDADDSRDTDLIWSHSAGKLIGIASIGATPSRRFFDPRRQQVAQLVATRWAQSPTELADISRDGRQALVRTRDRHRDSELRVVNVNLSVLESATAGAPTPAPASPGRRVAIARGDGTALDAQHYAPKTPDAAGAIVIGYAGHTLPHPDDTDFLPAFLSELGYHALTIAQRNSTGAKDDFALARQWLIQENGVDGQRVCVGGWGNGAVLAVHAAIAVREPFACVIAIDGFMDLVELSNWTKWHPARQVWLDGLTRDGSTLKSISPQQNLRALTTPILLIQPLQVGTRQRIVLNKFVRTLRRRDIPHQVLILPNSSYRLDHEPDRAAALRHIATFLNEGVGPSLGLVSQHQKR